MQYFNFNAARHAKKSKIKFPFSFHALIATWFYTGRSPVAPGTVGSLATYPLYLIVINSVSDTFSAEKIFMLLTVILTLLGTWAVAKLQKQIKIHDHQCIVIDEVVGMLLCFALVMGSATKIAFWLDYKLNWTIPSKQMSFFIVFIVFRYFDVRKPFFIKTLDRHIKKPIGVLADDLLAALFASAAIYIVASIVKVAI